MRAKGLAVAALAFVCVGVVVESRDTADAGTAAPDRSYVQPAAAEQWSAPVAAEPIAVRITAERVAAAEAESRRQAAIAAVEAEAAAQRAAAERSRQEKAAAQAAAQKKGATAQKPATPAPVGAPTNAMFDALAQCESRGNPTAVSSNGKHYGAFQFSLGAWASVGYSGYPTDYPYDVQREAAKKLQASRGWKPWPSCSRKLGYL